MLHSTDNMDIVDDEDRKDRWPSLRVVPMQASAVVPSPLPTKEIYDTKSYQ